MKNVPLRSQGLEQNRWRMLSRPAYTEIVNCLQVLLKTFNVDLYFVYTYNLTKTFLLRLIQGELRPKTCLGPSVKWFLKLIKIDETCAW
jgi:hypothetical protein